MHVVVCLDGHTQLRMGCLTTLLRWLERDPDMRVDFVPDIDALRTWAQTQPSEELICVMRGRAELTDPGRVTWEPGITSPYEIRGVDELYGWSLNKQGALRKDTRRDWFVRVGRASDLVDPETVYDVREDIPLSTYVDYTFCGDFGRRDLLRIR